jgi:DNA-binding winged helix-turn-helix (wHTH) protein/TolB-like protein
VQLTPKAFQILCALIENHGRLINKDELIKKVWPNSFVEEANLSVNISALRKALGDTPDGQRFIQTVPKRGYRFVMPIREVGNNSEREIRTVDSSTTVALEQDAVPVAATRLGSSTIRALWLKNIVIAVLVAFAIGYFAYSWYQKQPTTSTASAHVHKLAILPFQNANRDPNSDFLGFSMADAIIVKLGYVSTLTVRPSSSIQKYRDEVIDPQKVAAELDIDTLLTGTFIHEGDKLRVNTQLIDVRTNNILWRDTLDLKYEKLLTVQDAVVGKIIQGLELHLTSSETERMKPDAPVNPLAYEYYLRGVDLYSRAEFGRAIEMFEASAGVDPNYASNWAHLGRAYTADASFGLGGRDRYLKAQAAFERALSLQPAQIEAKIYIANLLTDTGRVEQAVPLLREALKANPNYSETHWELGYAYRFAGMLRESLEECARARALDPGVKLNTSAMNAYLYLGQYDEFLDSIPKSSNAAFNVFYRGFGEYYKHDYRSAAQDFDRAFEMDPSLLQAQVGKALSYGIAHKQSRGIEILREVEKKIEARQVGDPEAAYKIAQAYAELEDKTSAFRVLARSINNGFFAYSYLVSDPLLDSLRREPQFADLLQTAYKRHEAFKRNFF